MDLWCAVVHVSQNEQMVWEIFWIFKFKEVIFLNLLRMFWLSGTTFKFVLQQRFEIFKLCFFVSFLNVYFNGMRIVFYKRGERCDCWCSHQPRDASILKLMKILVSLDHVMCLISEYVLLDWPRETSHGLLSSLQSPVKDLGPLILIFSRIIALYCNEGCLTFGYMGCPCRAPGIKFH
jgi:hypothetical protein